jgi:ABC-2 type transport system ATP-binding protein
VIVVSHLSKAYGEIQALDDVSFTIQRGEIVGLLGPNGAGKTTLMKILTGYLQPDEGTATIADRDVLTRRHEVQALIGYLPENAPLYHELSVQGYLKLMADLRRIPPAEQTARISEAVYATGLETHLTRRIGELSKGYRQRVELAQAILHRPQLLILDEPTVGLDPTQIVEIRHLIRQLARHSTILLSTHILPEVEQVCDRVIILMNGRVRADARLAELAATSSAVLVLQEATQGVDKALRGLDGIGEVRAERSADGFPAYRVFARQADGRDLTWAIYRLAQAQGWPVRELRRETRTLEAVFNELAGSPGLP